MGDLDHLFFSCLLYDRDCFLNSLITQKVPFPTRMTGLLLNPYLNYDIISSFTNFNDIKISLYFLIFIYLAFIIPKIIGSRLLI